MLIHELKIIRQALLNEQEGYDFYTLAGNQAESQEAKEAFSQLAAEEQKHIEWLREMYKQLAANNPDGFDFSKIADPPAPGLYTKKNIGRESGSLAVSVFGIGVNMDGYRLLHRCRRTIPAPRCQEAVQQPDYVGESAFGEIPL